MAFHIRYTPYELSQDITGFFASLQDKSPEFAAGREVQNKKKQACELHYHMYIEVNLSSEQLKNRLKDYFKIPHGMRGKANAYFACMKVEQTEHMKKFTHGYAIKDGCIQATSYSDEEDREAVQYYMEHRRSPVVVEETQETPLEVAVVQQKETQLEQFAEYCVYIDKQLKKEPDVIQPYTWFRKKSRRYWYDKCPLFPDNYKFKKFLNSKYYDYCLKLKMEEDEEVDASLS